MACKDRVYKRARRTGRAKVVLAAMATADLAAVADLALAAAPRCSGQAADPAGDGQGTPGGVSRTWPLGDGQQQWPWQ